MGARWLVLEPMGILCSLSLGTSTQQKGKLLERNLRPFSGVLECVHVYVHVFTGRYMCACAGRQWFSRTGKLLEVIPQELLRPLPGSSPSMVDILPVICPFPNPSSQHALIHLPSVCTLRIYSEIHTLSSCWCLKIRLPMRPHGHSIHPLTVFLFLWPVFREPSFGKEI